MSKPKSLRARLTLTTAMAGALLISYGGRASYAGSCPPVGGGAYSCSGGAVPGEAGVSIDYGGPVTVTTSGAQPAGFGIDTTGTADTAISIKADGGLTFNDTNSYGSIITGADDGLYAKNENGGALTITTKGPVTGLAGDGIEASNDADGTTLTISATSVIGGEDGIDAVNSGTGALKIVATGSVIGYGDDGIEAINFSNGTDLTVSAAGVSAGQNGIYAKNSGTGDLIVTADGAVTADSGSGIDAKNYNGGVLSITANEAVSSSDSYGILAYNGPGTSGLTISADAITSKNDGIAAKHLGSGDLVITAGGTITSLALPGEQVDGIDVNNGADGANLTVTTAAVTGQQDGIDASNSGTGALSIFASGPVIGTDDEGIDAFNSDDSTNLTIEAADVSGKDKGIQAINNGFGDLTITVTGTVTGTTDDGVRALNDPSATNLTISAAAVNGGQHGIYAKNEGTGDLRISADGTVTSGEAEGIDARIENVASGGDIMIATNDVNGGATGIAALHEGTGSIEITANGTVFGGLSDNSSGSGIIARIVNDGSSGDVTVDADTVIAEQDGIVARNEGAGSVTVIADGLVSTTNANSDGIVARNFIDGDVTVSAASVDGARFGILASNRGDGSLYVSASGTVTGHTGDGILAADDFGSNGLNVSVSAADVHGGVNGIFAQNIGTGFLSVTAGNVTGELFEGVRASLINGTDATILVGDVSAGRTGISASNRGNGSLSITAGTVTGGLGGDGNGITAALAADGDDLIISAASVSGAAIGIYAINEGTGALSIAASGTVAGGQNEGIRARITNTESGGDLTVSAADVNGDTYGIVAENRGGGGLTVTADGAVVGGTNDGIRATNTADGTQMTISAASVSGGGYGVFARSLGTGDLSVTTEGAVSAGSGDGILAWNYNGGALSVTATDLVTSIGGEGIYTNNFAGSTSVTISAAGVSAERYGIIGRNEGSGDFTVTSTGRVTSTIGAGIFAENLNGGALGIHAEEAVESANSVGINARNLVGTTHLTIETAGIDAGKQAINALNEGTGDLSITVSGPATGGTYGGIVARNVNGGALGITAMDTVTATDEDGMYAFNDVGGTHLTISAAGVSGGSRGVFAFNQGSGDLGITTTGQVIGNAAAGITALNAAGGDLSIVATDSVSGLALDGIFARNLAGTEDLTVSAAGVSGANNGIVAINDGAGAVLVTATATVSGDSFSGILARGAVGGTDLTISAASVSGGVDAISATHRGTGDLLIAVYGTVSGGTGAGINNVDPLALGGTIEVAETASVSAASGVAVMDGDGGTLVWSEGALAGDVMLNGGADEVALFNGSATGLLGLGSGDDTMEIFGAGAGGGWDDADFSGTFDGNLGQVLQISGGDGLDTVELFGVTAASQALGVPTGLEALALSGNTFVQANDADLTPFGAVFVDPTSTLQAEGNSPSETEVGSLGNEGVVDLADGEANDVLRVTGDYAGATGSRVLLDLDTGAGTSDTLVIDGDVTDVSVGPFTVMHDRSLIDVNLIGAGSRTTGDGIRLIEVSGAVDGNDFALSGPVEADIFGYELVLEDGVHFLRSDFFDQIYLYENLPGAMHTIGLALTGQLVERVGLRSAVPSALADADGNPVAGGAPVDTALWGRAVGLSVESEGDLNSVTGTSFDQTVGFVQAGVDVTVLERQSGRLLIGALGHWGTSSLDANTFDGDDAGSADFDFYGGGLTATWYSTQGWYFDNVVQYTAYDIDISTASRFSTTSTDGYAITTSHEVGYRIPISETAALVPQAQLTYQHIDFDDFIDPDGVRISLDDGDSLIGRAGLAFENSAAIGSALATGYLEANVLHEFLGDNSVNVATGFGTTPISQETRGTSVELGFGGTVAVSRGVSLYAEVDYTIPFDNGVQGVQALGGIRVNLNPPPPPPLPAPVIAPVSETAFIVFFDWDQADLTSEANLALDEVAVVANETGYASIRLDGYTDLSGSAAYNLGLSERRANSVANGLIARGIAPDEIVIRAFGEENPLVPTPDGVREPQNRRVEIFLS